METPIIELKDIRKSFGPVEVLKGVDMQVYAGKVTALVGDNGAGKSTLIKGLSGAQPYDSGDVSFEGTPITLAHPRDASQHGIEVVYQDLSLCENLDIVQNMFLGREEVHQRMLNQAEMEKHARETLQGLSVRTMKSVRQKVSSLSGGQRQTVAIARAVLQKAKLVILDEPTAALGVAQTEQVLALVRRLADAGVGVIIISHNLADVFEVSDYINVLYLGAMVAQLKEKETNYNDVVAYITGIKGDTAAAEEVDEEEEEVVSGPRQSKSRRIRQRTRQPRRSERRPLTPSRPGTRAQSATRSTATCSVSAAAKWACCPQSPAWSLSPSCSSS